jgi:hypothetical protein
MLAWEKFQNIGGTLALTPWKFLKWAVMNQITFKARFLDALPLPLLELLPEFSSEEIAVRTTPKWQQKYHKLIYLKTAKKVMQKSKKRMTRSEIYDHFEMEFVRRTFKDQNGKQVHYEKRTITDSWLKEIDPCPRGRPPKEKKNRKKSH